MDTFFEAEVLESTSVKRLLMRRKESYGFYAALENLVKNKKLRYVDYSKQRVYAPSHKKAMLLSCEMQTRSCL